MRTIKKQRVKGAMEKTPAWAEYLKKPYGRTVVPESDGTFRAEIIEFPGCIATGETASEALANLEGVAASWLEATLARGQRIPEPIENAGFSGKLVVRLPKTLHKKAAHMAAREGISLNQFIVSSVAEQIGARSSPAPIGQFQSLWRSAGSVVFTPNAIQVLEPRLAQLIAIASSGNPVTCLQLE
jgi:antitoxin HicB